MPNGKPGDAPWSDFFVHGKDVFPLAIAGKLKRVRAYDDSLIRHFANNDMWDWERGERIEEGVEKLQKIIDDHKIP